MKPLILSLVAATHLCQRPCRTEAAIASPRPDILFILLDDLRWDGLSYKGHPYVETPNIDRLRDLGADMQNAFCTTSICCPSRATFLTGTYANRHGVIDNETSEYNPEVTPPLTKYLQEAGYKTAMIGKWHMGHSAEPRPYFDHWISFPGQGKYHDVEVNVNGKTVQWNGYTTDLLTDETITFINRQAKGQPWFCMLSHKAVHEPFEPHPRHADAFGKNQADVEPESWSSDFKGKPDWHRRQRSRDVRWDYRTRDYEEENLPEAIGLDPWIKGQKKYIQQFRCLAAVDDGVGKLLTVLKDRGTLDNTLIIFTSDNGYFHGEHRRWDKRLAMEESMRIPMVVAYPRHIKAGSTVTEMVSNVDFAPTVLGYAGIPVPERMQGLDMRPLLEGESPEWRDSVFYEYWVDLVHSIPTMTAVRTERYKLIQYPEIDDLDELYDLKADPQFGHRVKGDMQPRFAVTDAAVDRQPGAPGWRTGRQHQRGIGVHHIGFRPGGVVRRSRLLELIAVGNTASFRLPPTGAPTAMGDIAVNRGIQSRLIHPRLPVRDDPYNRHARRLPLAEKKGKKSGRGFPDFSGVDAVSRREPDSRPSLSVLQIVSPRASKPAGNRVERQTSFGISQMDFIWL